MAEADGGGAERAEGGRALGALIAGGRSRRFGSPKALAPLAGRALAERARDALLGAVPEAVLISADDALTARLGLPARPDQWPELGPLGGIHTALLWARERRLSGALCLACDLPFVPAPLLRALLERSGGGEAAVAPQGEGGAEPLCAYYPSSCLPLVERRLRAGMLSPRGLLEEMDARLLPAAEVRAHGDPRVLFANINTPEDYQRAMSLLSGAPTSRDP